MTVAPELIAALVTVIVSVIGAGIRKVWVWGWAYQAEVEEKLFWRTAALKLMSLNDTAIGIAERKVPGA